MRHETIELEHRQSGTAHLAEVNTLLRQRPKALHSAVQNLSFLATLDRHLPDTSHAQFRVIHKLAIERFKRFSAALMCNLQRRASLCWRFPDLPISAPIGTEINPPAISGPARTHVI